MLYQILINFSLLFTFTVLVFWPFIHYFDYTTKWSEYVRFKKIVVGIAFGTIGTLVTYLTLDYSNGLMVSARFIPLLFCGLLGGPSALLIAGLLMNATRLLFFPISDIGIIMSVNLVLTIFILYFVSKKIPITYRSITHYFYYTLLEIAIVLLFFYNFTLNGLQIVTTLILFSVTSFYAILKVLEQSQFASEKVKKTLTLNQLDYVTQLPNNVAIEEHLRQMIVHTESFSYLHIDIDQFQHYNFKHSYHIGDLILEELASIFKRESTKRNAFIGRTSGEEFCIVLPHTPPAIAIYEADQIRKRVSEHVFLKDKGLELKVTISIGISTYPENGPMIDHIFQNAHRALRSISNDSYNHVCHYNQYVKDTSVM